MPNHLAPIQLPKLTSSLNSHCLLQLCCFLPNSEHVQGRSHSILLHLKLSFPAVISLISFHGCLTLIFQILIQMSFKNMPSNGSTQIFLHHHHTYFLLRIEHVIFFSFIYLFIFSLSETPSSMRQRPNFSLSTISQVHSTVSGLKQMLNKYFLNE